ncbi:MAG: hypothetical protein ACKONH_06245 [Planctomycetia bacterium]
MNRSSLRRGQPVVFVAALCAGLCTATAFGQGGWLPAAWFSQAEVDAKQMFPLAEKDGPWLVLATTFRGEGAREDARRLVQELRTRHRLQAYTHEKSFDYTGTQKGVGFNPDGSPKTMKYANAAQVLEVAVLVGDFATCEDPRGQKVLQRIKTLQPEALAGEGGKSRAFSDFRSMAGLDKAKKGPMHLAFMIPNPLLPEDYFNRHEVDAFVQEMNADVTHSLLDCPARYSVRVATFTGSGMIGQAAEADPAATSGGLVDVSKLVGALRGQGWQDPKLQSMQSESRLVEAADKAHRLTVALRRQGFQAWEFHDRESSVVCVGSINQLAVPQADGKAVVNPEITKIVAALGPNPAKMAQGVIEPRAFDGIFLDVDPKPIDVPRTPTRRR